jgi:phosphate transport system permease protein
MSQKSFSAEQDPQFQRKLKFRERIGRLFRSFTFLSVILALLALGALVVNVLTNGRLIESMHSFAQTQQVTLGARAVSRGSDVTTYTRVSKELSENTRLLAGDVIIAFNGNTVQRSRELWAALQSASDSELQNAELRWIPRLERVFGDVGTERTDAGRRAIVEDILIGSPAEAAGIAVGDIIVAVNGAEVGRSSHVFEEILLAKLNDPSFDPIEFTIERNGELLSVSLNPVLSTQDRYERNIFEAFWYFVTNFDSRFPEIAGMESAVIGSIFIIIWTAIIALPIGIGAAIYLEEYAKKGFVSNFINVNISNLAGVPSVVYGIIGLELFARAQVLNEVSDWLNSGIELLTGTANFIPHFEGLGRTILAGALTMTLLILPIIIINAREALKAVPYSMREAAFGVGATRWQVVRHHVLPYSLPGVFTGVILAISRAIGETAPLLLLGAFLYVPFTPDHPFDVFKVFTVMPLQILDWTNKSQDGYPNLAAAAILVLLTIMLMLNAVAIFLRNRFQMRW